MEPCRLLFSEWLLILSCQRQTGFVSGQALGKSFGFPRASVSAMRFFDILLGGTAKLLIKGSIEGSDRVKAAFQGAVGKGVSLLMHQSQCVLQPDGGQILAQPDMKTGFEVSGQITRAVAEYSRERI